VSAEELGGHWAKVRHGLLQALDMLSDTQLDFVPRSGMWSLGTVARHVANAEEGWFRYAVTRELAEWPADYSTDDYPTVESVKALLVQVHQRTEMLLTAVDITDLDRMREMPWGEKLSLRQVTWHVLEHEIHHRGEIYLMLGMMGLEAPDV
jgi:uncharacterized damage-inducible protein DinB